MDNKDFDKIFSDGLQEEQHFDFQERDWDEVETRIQEKPRRKFLWWMWLIPLLLIGFTSAIYCLKSDLNKANEQVFVLSQKVEDLQVLQSDTQYQKITIVQYDTIKKTIVREKIIQKEKMIFVNETIERKPKNESFLKNKTHSNLTPALSESNVDTINFNTNLPVDLLKSIELKEAEEISVLEEKEEQLYLKEWPSKQKIPLYVDRFKIGVTNAWGVKENFENLFYNQGLSTSFKGLYIDLGIRSEWAFNMRWRAMATVSVERLTTTGSYLADSYQSILVPTYSSNLIEVSTTQTALQYQIGIKHLFARTKKWTPYIGVYLDAQSQFKQKVKATSQVNYDYLESNSLTLRSNKFKMNSASQIFGFEYEISRRFSWQIEEWFRFSFRKLEERNYAKFGIRNTLIYHF